MADISKYTFGKSALKKSAGSFKVWAKEMYPKLTIKDVDALVERYYGKEEPVKEEDDSSTAKKKAGAADQ